MNWRAEWDFGSIAYQDVTAAFRQTCVAFLDARRALETELRAEEGDAFFEEELAKKETMLPGIDEGLLKRALIVTKINGSACGKVTRINATVRRILSFQAKREISRWHR